MHAARDADPKQRFREEAMPQLPALVRVARMLTGDVHAADDLVQETMLRAYRHIGTYESGTNIKAWLMTILRRTHIDLYRRDNRRLDAGSLDAMPQDPPDLDHRRDPSVGVHDEAWTEPEQLMNRFDDASIESALRALPKAMRWTLLLVDVEQMPVADAAAVLDVAAGTIKSRASRARAQLRDALIPIARQRGWLPDDKELTQ